jgi:hypothetical protein
MSTVEVDRYRDVCEHGKTNTGQPHSGAQPVCRAALVPRRSAAVQWRRLLRQPRAPLAARQESLVPFWRADQSGDERSRAIPTTHPPMATHTTDNEQDDGERLPCPSLGQREAGPCCCHDLCGGRSSSIKVRTSGFARGAAARGRARRQRLVSLTPRISRPPGTLAP